MTAAKANPGEGGGCAPAGRGAAGGERGGRGQRRTGRAGGLRGEAGAPAPRAHPCGPGRAREAQAPWPACSGLSHPGLGDRLALAPRQPPPWGGRGRAGFARPHRFREGGHVSAGARSFPPPSGAGGSRRIPERPLSPSFLAPLDLPPTPTPPQASLVSFPEVKGFGLPPTPHPRCLKEEKVGGGGDWGGGWRWW